ncbi:uncharacterized protein LOC144716747 [Wolffia australiana]
MAIPCDGVLTRKLCELERVLGEAVVFGGEEEGGSGELSRRIDFLRNLLCAEMESHKGEKPAHLYHVADRLGRLDETYRKWAEGGPYPDPAQSLDSASSSCSCTLSCFDEEEDVGFDSPRPIGPDVAKGRKVIATAVAALLAAATAAVIFVTGFLEEDPTGPLVPT